MSSERPAANGVAAQAGAAMIDLENKLHVFLQRGLIRRPPTNWQVAQGSLAMARTVIAVKPDDRARYHGSVFGSPWLRTPVLVVYTLGGHLRIGAGIRARERQLRTHLLGVIHHGQPVFDLQLVQTFEQGLERLLHHLDAVDRGQTWMRRLERRVVDAIVPDGAQYRERLRRYVERAAKFDYDDGVPPGVRPEFSTFVRFMNHCAEAYPARSRDEHVWVLVRRLAKLFIARRLPPASCVEELPVASIGAGGGDGGGAGAGAGSGSP